MMHERGGCKNEEAICTLFTKIPVGAVSAVFSDEAGGSGDQRNGCRPESNYQEPVESGGSCHSPHHDFFCHESDADLAHTPSWQPDPDDEDELMSEEADTDTLVVEPNQTTVDVSHDCGHYISGCLPVSSCCGKLYSCRFCHDAEQDHEMNRKQTREVVCRKCETRQAAGPSCTAPYCGQLFARYYCDECKLWEDRDGKEIFHCSDCGICRVGKQSEVFHCKTCRACVNLENATGEHQCVENALMTNCPVCCEFLFTSMKRVSYLQCGHAIHRDCLTEYVKYFFTCPLCKRALGKMDEVYGKIDELLRNSFPQGSDGHQVEIGCNECNRTYRVPHHPVYLKCPDCNGYNTRFIRRIPVSTAAITTAGQ